MYEFGVGERTPWRDFPPVIRNAELGKLRRETEYVSAKQGSDMAALLLVNRMLSDDAVEEVYQKFDSVKPTLLPVLAMDSFGKDRIPLAMSCILADKYGWDIELDIVQADRINRMGSSVAQRMAFNPRFDGRVERGRSYLIVDDSLFLGGTIASLRGYVENRGGRAVGAMVMTAGEQTLNLAVTQGMKENLVSKHGPELNSYFKENFGYGIDRITQNEAAHLAKAPSFDAIRDKISEARNEYVGNLDAERSKTASNNQAPDHQGTEKLEGGSSEPAYGPGNGF